jgi:hypothetical protein
LSCILFLSPYPIFLSYFLNQLTNASFFALLNNFSILHLSSVFHSYLRTLPSFSHVKYILLSLQFCKICCSSQHSGMSLLRPTVELLAHPSFFFYQIGRHVVVPSLFYLFRGIVLDPAVPCLFRSFLHLPFYDSAFLRNCFLYFDVPLYFCY